MIVLMKKVKYQNMRQTNDRKKESIYRVERRDISAAKKGTRGGLGPP